MPERVDALATRLRDIICTEFDLTGIALDARTRLAEDLLIDSLAKVELAMVIEDEFVIGLADTTVGEIHTFGQLCAAVTARIAQCDYDASGEPGPGIAP